MVEQQRDKRILTERWKSWESVSWPIFGVRKMKTYLVGSWEAGGGVEAGSGQPTAGRNLLLSKRLWVLWSL